MYTYGLEESTLRATSEWFIDVLAHRTEVFLGSSFREFCFRVLIISREVIDVENDIHNLQEAKRNHNNSSAAA
jgi:hypothetical protein